MESPKDDSKDVKYITLNFKSQLSPEDPLYCNVEPSQAHRKPKDENVEYATIALKQLPTNDKGWSTESPNNPEMGEKNWNTKWEWEVEGV